MIGLVIAGFTLIGLLDFLPLVRRRKRREIIAFSCVFTAALTLSVLAVFSVEVPSLMHAWGSFLRWIGLGYAP